MTNKASRPPAPGVPIGTALTFLLLGLGAGTLLGILYAPKPGRQTRKELNRKFRSAKESLEDWSEDARDLAEQAIDRGSQLAEELRNRVKPFADTLRQL
jgi:gas vesicle protein